MGLLTMKEVLQLVNKIKKSFNEFYVSIYDLFYVYNMSF